MANDTFLHMRIAPYDVESLDDLRRKEPDLPTRSEMVRRLIARATGRTTEREASKRAARR